MIFDTLMNSRRYDVLSSRMAKAFEVLRNFRGNEAVGRHEIAGDEIYAMVQKYTTEPMENMVFEVHRRYIDVQYVHAGRETVLYAPLSAMRKAMLAYDEAKDAALFELVPDTTHLRLSDGCFAILFPEDAHAPCMVWGKTEVIVKVVIKVAV